MIIRSVLPVFTVLVFTHTAGASLVGTDWTTAFSGDLNGTAVTLAGLGSPAPGVSTFDLSGGDYAGAPLGASEDIVFYANSGSWTATFAAPVTDLHVYAGFWLGKSDEERTWNFDQPFTIVSGFGGISGSTPTSFSGTGSFNGVLKFDGPLTSLTLDAPDITPASVFLTFGAPAVPEPGSLAMLGLAGLALLRRRRVGAPVPATCSGDCT